MKILIAKTVIDYTISPEKKATYPSETAFVLKMAKLGFIAHAEPANSPENPVMDFFRSMTFSHPKHKKVHVQVWYSQHFGKQTCVFHHIGKASIENYLAGTHATKLELKAWDAAAVLKSMKTINSKL